jgi:zinc transport system substrate-binding protein
MIVMRPRIARFAAGLVPAVLVGAVAGCGGGADASGGRLRVVAAFYPLEFAVSQIGGPDVHVSGLTRPGAEPHDLELTPRDVVAVRQAGLVVYEEGFQTAVDAAVAQVAEGTALDIDPAAKLVTVASEEPQDHEGPAEEGGSSGLDPHFWLDPIRYAAVGTAIGGRLAAADPAHAAAYRQRAETFAQKLAVLDRDFDAGLAHCRSTDLVTAHAAFAYLAQRYGFTQRSVTGLSPEAEPDAANLRSLIRFIRSSGATTVYAEPLVSPRLADTVAHETGVRVAVLDPVEGITKHSAASDYFGIMRANLATLQKGQGCT